MTRAYVVAAARTAVAPRGGVLSEFEPHALAAPVVTALLKQAGLVPGEVDELIAGNALGAGGNPARLVALAAGLPLAVAGLSIDRQCVSGLDALRLADALVRAGAAEVVVAGGVESYSRRPIRLHNPKGAAAPVAYDRPPFSPWPDRDPEMPEAADLLARELGISRADQDEWAMTSHQKALAAKVSLSREIVALNGATSDPFARNLTPALCARAQVLSGSVTAANTAVAADAAAFCLVVSERVAKRLGTPALAICATATLGAAPERPGTAPLAAIASVLAQSGRGPRDFAAIEVMEAYAAQAIACVRAAGLDPDRTNLGGGALARGHPIGASGAVNAVRLYHELAATGGHGLATIAAAGGLGSALILRG